MKSSPLIWRLLHTVKLTVKILSIFVAFLENVNFNIHFDLLRTYADCKLQAPILKEYFLLNLVYSAI